jgi:hypothetical protein
MALGEVIACATLTSRRHGAGLSGSATQHWRGPLWDFAAPATARPERLLMRIATDIATSSNIGSFAEQLLAEMSTIMRPFRPFGADPERPGALDGHQARAFHQSDPGCTSRCPAAFSGAHIASL